MVKKIDEQSGVRSEEQLYRALAGKIKGSWYGGYSESKYMYRILQKMCSIQEAALLLALPGFPADLAQRLHLDSSWIESALHSLGQKGLVFETRRGWFLPRSIFQFHDSALTNPNFDKEFGEEYFSLWEEFCEKEWFPAQAAFIRPGVQGLRIVPDARTLAPGAKLAAYEDLQTMFEIMAEDGKLGLIPCACKRAKPSDTDFENYWGCIVWGRSYEYNLQRQAVQTFTPASLVKAIEKLHDKGMVSLAPDSKNFVSIPATWMFCQCHSNYCDVMRPYLMKGIPLYQAYSPSRYIMSIAESECTGCQACEQTCLFDAIHIPQEKAGAIARIDPEKCMGCGNCALGCPTKCLQLTLSRPAGHVPDDLY